MRSKKIHLAMAVWLAFCSVAPQALWAKAARSAFEQTLADIKSAPEDRELRIKILKLARDKKDLPELPDEVAVLKGKISYVMKNATGPADFRPAVAAALKATLLAPWSGDLYFNLGVVEEKAEMPQDAIDDFKLYLVAKPNAEDKPQVLERLGKLEVMEERKGAETERAVVHQQNAAQNSEAVKAWEGRQAGAMIVGVLGGITLGLGAIFLGLGYGQEGGALYTTTPGYSSGVLYNVKYQGKYYSSSSYADYKGGEDMVGSGWLTVGIGSAAVLIAIIMSPGPRPSDGALLELNSGKLALKLPEMQPTQYGGIQGTLLHATF